MNGSHETATSWRGGLAACLALLALVSTAAAQVPTGAYDIGAGRSQPTLPRGSGLATRAQGARSSAPPASAGGEYPRLGGLTPATPPGPVGPQFGRNPAANELPPPQYGGAPPATTYGLPPGNAGYAGETQYQMFPEPMATTPPPAIDRDLIVVAPETTTGRLSMGVGVNSNAGLTGSIILDEQNFDIFKWPRSFRDVIHGNPFRGRGQHFRLEALPGTQLQRYSASLTEPYLFNTPVSLGLSGFFYTRRFIDWDEQRLGGRVNIGYEFAPNWTGSVGFRGEQVEVFNPAVPTPQDLVDAIGENTALGFSGRLAWDTRDSAFMPTEGHYAQATFEQVTGTFDYPVGTLDLRKYFLLHQRADRSGRHVMSLSSTIGITGANTPIYERFFAGGFTTMRGFRFREANPHELGVSVGGEFEWLNSVEYLFPITADDMLRGVVFCDYGTIEESVKIDWDDFRVAPGFGLRINVAAMGPAPIALDFAFPVASEVGDREQIFQFFVGLMR